MKSFCFLAFVLFGFLLMPSGAFACGNNSEKHSCKKEISLKKDKKDCCDKDCCDSDNNHSKNKNHNCGGKCGHSSCTCPSASILFYSAFEINFKNNILDFSSEKQKFSNSETFISSGFYSLWLIPKIS